jgi:hypothetical protein
MTEASLERDWAVRRHEGEKIKAEPEYYKECDQCRSIVFRRTSVCPFCHSYRFNQEAERVVATVNEMLARPDPYPVTAGVVPRWSFQFDKAPSLEKFKGRWAKGEQEKQGEVKHG